MAASYPSALWVPDHIVEGTILEAVLLHRVSEEIDAIEDALGVNVHGSAGSLAERIDHFCGDDSGIQRIKLVDAGEEQRRRMRAGVSLISTDELTAGTTTALGTLTFSPPASPLIQNAIAFLGLQTLDQDDLSNPLIPSFVNFVYGSGTTTSFQYRVGTGSNVPPASGTQFILHWIVVDGSHYSSDLELP